MSFLLQWAHQGGAREGPSNTIWAMRRAKKAGANALEMDVHVSRDGYLVVAHDRRLGRIAGGRGRLSRLSLQEIQRVDAAYWWVENKLSDHEANVYPLRGQHLEDASLRIPTLDEVLDEFPDDPITIEIKAFRAANPLARLLQSHSGQNVTVTSFFAPILWWFRRQNTAGIGLAPSTAYSLWFLLRVRLGRPPATSRYHRLQVPQRKWGVRFLDSGSWPRHTRPICPSTPGRSTSPSTWKHSLTGEWTGS